MRKNTLDFEYQAFIQHYYYYETFEVISKIKIALNLIATHPSVPSLAKRGEAPHNSLYIKMLLRGVSSGNDRQLTTA